MLSRTSYVTQTSYLAVVVHDVVDPFFREALDVAHEIFIHDEAFQHVHVERNIDAVVFLEQQRHRPLFAELGQWRNALSTHCMELASAAWNWEGLWIC